MPTTFIAVQCFQCFTMQVKQAKRSSNKWVCVVCNQKQSVRRVFAEGLMAKHIRQFVQNFNMSRQLSDKKELALDEGEGMAETDQFCPKEDKKKKRTDWTEYFEYDSDDGCGRFEKCEHAKDSGDNEFDEAVAVTEMQNQVLKKPKWKDFGAGKRRKNVQYQDMQQTLGISCGEEEQVVSHKENLASAWNGFMLQTPDNNNDLANMEKSWLHQSNTKTNVSTSKSGDYITLSKSENTSKGVPSNHKIATNGRVSKWSSYITKEDDDDFAD